MEHVYSKTARYYDKLYAHKDYHGEVIRLVELLDTLPEDHRTTLLDVACGTGLHLQHLAAHFDVEGLDICPEQLEIARKRLPGVLFHVDDMVNFDLGKQFDIVTCLFSSIGYVKTCDRLETAVQAMATHLKTRGILVIEPWFTPENWYSNTVHGMYIDEPELKIARINTSFVEDRVSVFDLHHLIGTPEGTEHIVEHHELGLFDVGEMMGAMEHAGLTVEYDADGLSGRGLYLGKREG